MANSATPAQPTHIPTFPKAAASPSVAATSTLVPTIPQALPTITQSPVPPAPFQPVDTTTPASLQVFPTPAAGRTHYELSAVLDYPGHLLEVEQKIDYTNTTPERLSALPLVVEARRYPHAFELVSVKDRLGERFSNFQWKDTLLTLTLPGGLAPGDVAMYTVNYRLRLPDVDTMANTRPHPLGYNSQQANFGDWYPFVPPFIPGKGWLTHPPSMYGEHLVYDIADYEVAIRSMDARKNLVYAASALARQDGEWLRFTHQAARSFAWSASPYYQTASRTLNLVDGQTVELSSYYFAFHEQAGKALLDQMGKALILFTELFGTYQRPSLAGVQAGFIDGMEYDGLFFLSTDFYNWFKDPPADFLVSLAAHEIAHQWWSGLVGNDQAMQPWLDEALCTYSERIFYEHLYPAALDWWWEYRVNYYQPAGWVDISVYDVPQEYGHYRQYRDPVYLRGALFLEELRGLMGDQAFFLSLRQYAARYAYQQATATGFLQILEQNTGVDLAPLLGKYFHPNY